MDIAIIGSGLAGLTCARHLNSNGHTVSLFDKGRGPGGRLSTRRAETTIGELRWDHGAQYFTARSDGFKSAVSELVDAGAVGRWDGTLVQIDENGASMALPDEERYVGTPSMNQVIKTMAQDMTVRWGLRATDLIRSAQGWSIGFEGGTRMDGFDAVVIAVPAEQVSDLVRPLSSKFADEADAAQSAPCWAVMLAFDRPLGLPFDGAKLAIGPSSWITRNASKPGRGVGETWLLHGSAAWSTEHIEDDASDVAKALTDDFLSRFDVGADPIYQTAHRWRYAFVETPATSPFGWDEENRLGVCGDWRIGPRIEFAWQSGKALADAIGS